MSDSPPRTPTAHRICDGITEGILLFIVVFNPWLFGTTNDWAVWIMNAAGYAMGILLVAKWMVRWRTGYQPMRWRVLKGEGQRAEGREQGAEGRGQRTEGGGQKIEDGERSAEKGGGDSSEIHGQQATGDARVEPEALSVRRARLSGILTVVLAILTVLVLAYCFISAANARASFRYDPVRMIYHECIEWLPHSYCSQRSWFVFWEYLGLAFFFWATRDWLLTKTHHERRFKKRKRNQDRSSTREGSGEAEKLGGWEKEGTEDRGQGTEDRGQGTEDRGQETEVRGQGTEVRGQRSEDGGQYAVERSWAEEKTEFQISKSDVRHPKSSSSRPSIVVPVRLRRLLWVLCLNGALLGIEGIVQRFEGSGKLLWLAVPRINRTAEAQFGPYPYRSNAAQYFNLVWPVCAGFAWMLRRTVRPQRQPRLRPSIRAPWILTSAAILMAACPIISTSRGGALTTAILVPAVLIALVLASRRRSWRTQLGTILLFLIPLQLGCILGWEKLKPRLEQAFADQLTGREGIYTLAERMAEDFPVFGTGPGTFSEMCYIYSDHPEELWVSEVHNDWQETRVTFGWIGYGLILLLFVTAGLSWFVGYGIPMTGAWVAMIWIALGGCLVHARFDFPLQVHSILTLFLLYCCILFCGAKPHLRSA